MFSSKKKLALLLSASATFAERTWLSRFSAVPPAKTLEVVHFITVDQTQSPEVSVAGPVRLDGDTPEGVELSVIPHASLATLGEGSAVFCCSKEMATSGQGGCKTANTLTVPGAYSFPINKETLEKGFGGQLYRVAKSGLYYIALSNCGDSSPKSSSLKFSSGELVQISRSGYLPAEEAAKLSFYLYLLLGYLVLMGLWFVVCSRWSDVLFKIHHYISITIAVGAVEAACWYSSLYHWNFIGHRWWSMMALASFGTVVKQGVSYGLLLLACLGLGVTKPRLEGKQVLQVFLLVTAFIVSDGIRQMALLMQDRVNGVASSWKILLLVTPGSFFVSVLYVWILQALQDTLAELNSTGQTVKAQVYSNLRLALGCVVSLVVALVAYETIVVRRTELAENWESRYIFTDVLSHSCFFLLLAVIMQLWRPSERSVQMAYSVQLDKNGNVMNTEMENIGEAEKDFNSVDVELGDEGGDDDFSFKKSMEENSKKGKPVLE